MLAVMADNPPAACAGLLARVCLAAWPLFRTRSVMLSIYVGNNLAFVLHYALLHHWTAVTMNGLIAAQNVAAIGFVRYPRLRLVYFVAMPVMVGVAFLTWQGTPLLLSASATALSTLGRMQGSETILRTLLLASTPFWAGHDLIVGSLPGLIADLLSMVIGAAMLLRRPAALKPAAPVRGRNGAIAMSTGIEGEFPSVRFAAKASIPATRAQAAFKPELVIRDRRRLDAQSEPLAGTTLHRPL